MPRTGLAPEEIRERAIAIARLLIRDRGPDRLRLTDVAREMDVSHTALYAHFPNKAALLDAVLAQWLSDPEEKLAAFAATPNPDAVRMKEWLVLLHRLKVERATSDPQLYAAVNTATVRETPAARAHVAALLDQLGSLAAATGLPAPAASAALLFEATALYHHPALIGQFGGEARVDALERLVDVLVTGICGVELAGMRRLTAQELHEIRLFAHDEGQ